MTLALRTEVSVGIRSCGFLVEIESWLSVSPLACSAAIVYCERMLSAGKEGLR